MNPDEIENGGSAAETPAPDSRTEIKTIVAFLGGQALGDFCLFLMAAGDVKKRNPGSRLLVIYRDDRPYKTFLTNMAPFVDARHVIADDNDSWVPMSWFGDDPARADPPAGADWIKEGFQRPDLLLTGSNLWYCNYEGSNGPQPFRIPDEKCRPLAEALKSRGLDYGKWFTCLHMRESGYQYRTGEHSDHRSVEVESYVPMIRLITKEHGGQVVRIGDPSMTPLPEMPGLIDLALIEDSFEEQMFALSRARFFFGTDSGPLIIACALHTPSAITNSLVKSNASYFNNVTLTKTIRLPIGRQVRQQEAWDLGICHNTWAEDWRSIDNTPDELCAAARMIIDQTADTPGWRDPPADEPEPPKSGFKIPYILEEPSPPIWVD